MPSRIFTNAKGRIARICRRRTSISDEIARAHRREIPGPHAAGGSEPVAGGRGAYFGKGDECHMAFHFPLMPRMFMALQMEDRFPIIDILEQTPAIPEKCQWAMFLRNHDELTLEMVTDEERDYMYRVYANDPRARINLGIRRRLAPLLANNRRKIELINVLLLLAARARRSSTTATRSAWATTFTWATATACARRCNGARTATPVFASQSAAAVSAGDDRSRNITTKRLTWRTSRRMFRLCCGGCGA